HGMARSRAPWAETERMPTSHPSAMITAWTSIVRTTIIFATYEPMPPELGMWLLGAGPAGKRTSVTPAPPVLHSTDIEAATISRGDISVASTLYRGRGSPAGIGL